MKSIKFLILLFFPLASLAQGQFNISGKVGFDNAGLAILKYKVGDLVFIDTAKVKDKAFAFTGQIPYTVSANIQMQYYSAPGFKFIADELDFYLESKTIVILSNNYLKSGKISGSPLNDENEKLRLFVAQSNANSSIAKSNVYAKYASEHTNSLIGLVALSNSMVRDVDENTTQLILNNFTAELKNSRLGQTIQATINTYKNTRPGNIAPNFKQTRTVNI